MKIALISLHQFWEDKEKNLQRCLYYIQKASAQKVDVIIFPEMTLTGFSNNEAIVENEENSATLKSFCNFAINHKIAIIFGAVVKSSNSNFNSAYFIDDSGKIRANYQKIHPFSIGGENIFCEAGKKLQSISYKDINIGLTICYDLRFPELYTALTKNNDVIVNIANWPIKRLDHWLTLLKSRAIENQIFVIGVNRIGIDGNNLEYQESSVIYNANGEAIEPCLLQEEMKVFTLDKNWTKEFKSKFNTTNDRKIALYKEIL